MTHVNTWKNLCHLHFHTLYSLLSFISRSWIHNPRNRILRHLEAALPAQGKAGPCGHRQHSWPWAVTGGQAECTPGRSTLQVPPAATHRASPSSPCSDELERPWETLTVSRWVSSTTLGPSLYLNILPIHPQTPFFHLNVILSPLPSFKSILILTPRFSPADHSVLWPRSRGVGRASWSSLNLRCDGKHKLTPFPSTSKRFKGLKFKADFHTSPSTEVRNQQHSSGKCCPGPWECTADHAWAFPHLSLRSHAPPRGLQKALPYPEDCPGQKKTRPARPEWSLIFGKEVLPTRGVPPLASLGQTLNTVEKEELSWAVH